MPQLRYSTLLAGGAGLAATIWIPIYATRAFRHMYGGSLIRTLIKELGLATLLAFIVILYRVSIAR